LEEKMKICGLYNRTSLGILLMVTLGIGLLSSISAISPRAAAQQPQAIATPSAMELQAASAPQIMKPADVHIPHHRPGHLAKTRNLETLVVGGQNDPLAGNYTLVNWERIATFWTDDGDKVNTKTYAENETLSNPVPKAKQPHNMTIHAQDITTGHLLRNDLAADTIGVGTTSDGAIWLFTSKAASDLNSYTGGANVNTGSSVLMFNTHPSPIALASCPECGNASGYDAIFLAFQGTDGALVLQKYDTFGASLTPTGNGNWNFASVGNYALNLGEIDIATGDFQGNGYPDVAVAWRDPSKGTVDIRAFSSVVPDRIYASYSITESMTAPYISITTGDVTGDARDEIIVVWGGTQTNHTVKIGIFQVAPDLSAITPLRIDQLPDAIWQPTVAVGDFSLDGVDEIVVSAKAWHNAEIYLYVYDLTYDDQSKQWQLTQKANLHTGSAASNYPRLAAGDVNRNVQAEIVTTFTTGQMNNVQVFEVNAPSGGAWSITSKGKVSDERSTSDGYTSVFVTLGNLDAKHLRVGPPSHTLASNVLSTLAVIGMPPKHKDTLGGMTYVIDAGNTYAKYETQTKSTTQMSTAAKHAWDLSADFSYGFAPIFKMSIKATYGGDFEKTTSTFKSISMGYGLTANVDDGIVYSVQDIDVWEYPTYADNSDVPVGYMLVMFPQKVDPACSTNCEGAKVQTNGGSLVTSPYAANHEPYDLLSYSLNPPGNISTTIKIGGKHVMGDIAWYESVAWSDVQSDSTKQTERAGIGVEGSIGEKEAPGHLDLKSSYNFTHVGTNQTSFQQDTTISVWGDKLAEGNKYAYTIEPYFYWSRGGTLMLDYLVAPNADWWTSTYNQPDPAFNLPWKDGNQGDKYRLMTREITFDPPAPQAGASVTVTAKIRNYSPVAAPHVTVTLYKGDPDHGGQQFGSTHANLQVSPQGSVLVIEHLDTSGYAGQTLNIYALIAPYPNEIHLDNNEAYAQLPVKPHTSRSSPATLSVASGEITFHSAPATLGVPTYVTATVRARGDTFTNLVLEFWDGEPYRNGSTIIGGHLIPMVRRDEAVTEGIRWTPRAPGQRAIWAVVRSAEREDAYSDNRAYRTINVLPSIPYFIPLILK